MASDGIELFARSFGEATAHATVVCVPGLTRNSRDFTDLATDLAADRRVVAVDLRGRGQSGYDPSAATYNLDQYAADAWCVIDALDLGRVAVVGTSLGGLTAMWMGMQRPAALAGVVLNDVGPELQAEGLTRIMAYAGQLPPVGTWFEAIEQTQMVGAVATPDFSDADWERAARQRYRELDDGTVIADHDPAIVRGPRPTVDPWTAFDGLVGVPLLLLRGAQTDLLSPSTVAAMQERRPDLEVVEIPDRGHAPSLDEPVARWAIRHFLDVVVPGAAT